MKKIVKNPGLKRQNSWLGQVFCWNCRWV